MMSNMGYGGITYDEYPKQRDNSSENPQIGKEVKIFYQNDTIRCHHGVIVRCDMEKPFEVIIKVDNGRYLRASECHYSIIKDMHLGPQETPMNYNATDVDGLHTYKEHIDGYTMISDLDVTLKEIKGNESDRYVEVKVQFPRPRLVYTYYTKSVPTLREVMYENGIAAEYEQRFEKDKTGTMWVTITSRDEGRTYMYDVESGKWYFIVETKGLAKREQRRMELEKENIADEKKHQMKKWLQTMMWWLQIVGAVAIAVIVFLGILYLQIDGDEILIGTELLDTLLRVV